MKQVCIWLLNKNKKAQVCDATMFHSITKAGFKKISTTHRPFGDDA